MKKPVPFLLLFLVLTSISNILFGQGTGNASKYAQVKIMVIPLIKAGDDLRTTLSKNPDLNDVMDKVKSALEKRGFAVQDFEKGLKDATGANQFKAKLPADIKSTFIAYTGVDVYIEAGINFISKNGSNKVEVLLKAFDAATSKKYTDITCDSRERNNNNTGELADLALHLTVPPKDLYDDDNKKRSTIPCLDEFMNNLQVSLTDDVVK